MLTLYDKREAGLVPRTGMVTLEPETLWLDLLNPTPEEEKYIETELRIDIPTREELQEIEVSSRLYYEDGGHFMTVTLLTQIDQPRPVTSHITFVLLENRLVTIRYTEPYAFYMFAQRAMRNQLECGTAAAVLIGLLELIIDRAADLIERVQAEVDQLSFTVFSSNGAKPKQNSERFDEALKLIGRQGDLTTRVRESLLSLNRMLTYVSHAASVRKDDKLLRARVKTAARDVSSLSDHLNYLNGQITLLLDATLGMISIEQNRIIKIFSVVAVIFMPPTLVASLYGMNFHAMPELSWIYGYPWAIALMIVSAMIPIWYFRRRGWL